MTPARLKKFERQLTELRAELLSGRHSAKVEPNRTDDARIGQDEDEQPLNEMLQAVASGRNRNSAVMLLKVDRALAKLRDEPDDFGLCEECSEPILAKRLELVPYAALCLACQSKADGPKGAATRKKLTDYR